MPMRRTRTGNSWLLQAWTGFPQPASELLDYLYWDIELERKGRRPRSGTIRDVCVTLA